MKLRDCALSLINSTRSRVTISKRNLLLAVTIMVWLIVILIGLLFASKITEKQFDPAGVLYQAANEPDFDGQIKRIFYDFLGASLNNVVVHITSNTDCLCQLTATRHINSVKDTAAYSGKRNETVYIENIKGLSNILPSTPAIVIFDSLGKLSYLGPYSTGIGCLSGNGSVESYLNSKNTAGAIIPLESTGCYCNV